MSLFRRPRMTFLESDLYPQGPSPKGQTPSDQRLASAGATTRSVAMAHMVMMDETRALHNTHNASLYNILGKFLLVAVGGRKVKQPCERLGGLRQRMSEDDQLRREIAEALQDLAQDKGVQRDDLIKLLEGKLQILATAW